MTEIVCDCKVFFGVDDIEEELSSAEFLRMVSVLSAYKGAVRAALELWAREHEEELEAMKEAPPTPAITLSADQLRSNPRLGPAPAAGQAAPLFDVKAVS